MGRFSFGFGETKVTGHLEISCTSNHKIKDKYPFLYDRCVLVKHQVKLKYYLETTTEGNFEKLLCENELD